MIEDNVIACFRDMRSSKTLRARFCITLLLWCEFEG